MSGALAYESSSVQPYQIPAAAPESLWREVEQFLYYEAQLLDSYELATWMKLITPDIDYRIPIRSTIDSLNLDKAFSVNAFHMVEDYGSLAARMERLISGTGWSEKPPSRVRRHISNIRVAPAVGDDVKVRSNLLFFWARGQLPVTMSAERRDILRIVDGRLYLAKRAVLLDHVSIPIPNLSVVL
jgi:3-phenylpropionate/cinnamic acid dioxygenase small subunit